MNTETDLELDFENRKLFIIKTDFEKNSLLNFKMKSGF